MVLRMHCCATVHSPCWTTVEHVCRSCASGGTHLRWPILWSCSHLLHWGWVERLVSQNLQRIRFQIHILKPWNCKSCTLRRSQWCFLTQCMQTRWHMLRQLIQDQKVRLQSKGLVGTVVLGAYQRHGHADLQHSRYLHPSEMTIFNLQSSDKRWIFHIQVSLPDWNDIHGCYNPQWPMRAVPSKGLR